MITSIRTYFKARIKESYPDLKAHPHPTQWENIGDHNLDGVYFIKIGSNEKEILDQTERNIFEVQVRLFTDGQNQLVDKYDSGYCKAEVIAGNICKRSNALGSVLKNVRCSSIEPTSVGQDDNTFMYVLQFTVETHQSLL